VRGKHVTGGAVLGLVLCAALGAVVSTELLGDVPEEARSLSLFDVTHPDEHAVVTHLLSTGRGWRRRPFRCVTEAGAPVWLRSTAVGQGYLLADRAPTRRPGASGTVRYGTP